MSLLVDESFKESRVLNERDARDSNSREKDAREKTDINTDSDASTAVNSISASSSRISSSRSGKGKKGRRKSRTVWEEIHVCDFWAGL